MNTPAACAPQTQNAARSIFGEEIKKRLMAPDEEIAEKSDARLEDFEKLNTAYQPPSELGPDLIRVSTASSITDTVKGILVRLAEKQSVVSRSVPSVETR